MAAPTAKLLWMHNRLGYIYGRRAADGVIAGMPDRSGRFTRPKGKQDEHRAIHRQRSEVERRRAVHEGYAAVSAVRFLWPGRPDPRPHRRRLQRPQRP